MSRIPVPFIAGDISALAKSLRAQLSVRETPPSHVELLNMLARSTGHRNYQHLRSQAAGRETGDAPVGQAKQAEAQGTPDQLQVRKVSRHFSDDGVMLRWPGRQSHQQLCLWVLWSWIPARQVFKEAEVNALLTSRHAFGDHALLRRALCDAGLLSRTRDGREYRRVERKPPPEALLLIREITIRLGERSGAPQLYLP